MKNIRTIKALLFTAVLALFTSCGQLLNGPDDSKKETNEKNAVLSISLEDSSARTIAPVIALEDLKDFTLYEISDEKEKEIASWSTKADMEKASLKFTPGEYSFALTAKAGGVTLKDTQTVELSKGDNDISFTLAVSDYGTGNGDVEITLTYPGTDVASGTVLQLVNMEDSTEYSGTVESKTADSESGKTVVKFSASEIPAGTYRARTTIVVNSEKYVSYSDIVRVYEGYTSNGTYECTDFMKNGCLFIMDDIFTTEESDSIAYQLLEPIKDFNYNKEIIKGDKVTLTINAIALTDLNGLYFDLYSDSVLDDNSLILGEGTSAKDNSIKVGEIISLTEEIDITSTSKDISTDCLCLRIASDGLESDTKTTHRTSAAFVGSIDLSVDKSNRDELVTVTFDATEGTCSVNVITRYPGQTISDVVATNGSKLFDGWFDSDGNMINVVSEKDATLTARWVDAYNFIGDVNTTDEKSLILSNEVLSKNPGAVLNVKVSHQGYYGSYAYVITASETSQYIWGRYGFGEAEYTAIVKVSDLLRYLQGEDCVFYNFTTLGGWTIDECYLDFNIDDINAKIVEVNLELDGGIRTWADGTTNESRYYVAGNSVSYIGTPAKKGYEFDSWVDSEGNAVTIIPDTDCTIYAKWNSTCAISFNTKGGSSIDDVYVSYGNYAFVTDAYNSYFDVISAKEKSGSTTYSSDISNPTKADFVFDCWCTDEECTIPFATSLSDAVQITANTTLYAKWKEAYTISFVTNTDCTINDVQIACGTEAYLNSWDNGFYIMAPSKKNGSYSSISSLISNPTKDNYVLDGWYTDSNYTNKFATSSLDAESITSDITLYARWVETCVLSIETADGFTDVTIPETNFSASDFYMYLNFYDIFDNLKKDGYEWAGWYSDKECTKAVYDENSTDEDIISITGDMTLYAKWEPAYKIIFNTKDGSTIENLQLANGCYVYISSDYEYYEVHTSTDNLTFHSNGCEDLPTKSNFIFDGWYTDSDCTEEFADSEENAIKITKDVTLYAKWAPAVKISFITGEGSTVADHWVVKDKWYHIGRDPRNFTIYSSSEKDGTYTSEDINLPYRANYEFDGWYTDEARSAEFAVKEAESVQISENLTLYANWVELKTINFDTGDGNIFKSQKVRIDRKVYIIYSEDCYHLYIASSNEYVYGGNDYSLPTKDGYVFDCWCTDSACKTAFADSENPVLITEDITLYAKWTEESE